MFPRRRIAVFLGLFVLCYGLLLAAWPVVRPAYAGAYRAAANLVFGSFGAKDAVRFQNVENVAAKRDVTVVMSSPRTGAVATSQQSSREMGYLPTIVLVSLVLATPLPWRRKGRALLWGGLLSCGFVGLRIALVLLRDFSQDDPLRLFELGATSHALLAWAIRALVYSTGSYYAFPVLIWVLVTFRREDWATLFGEASSATSPPSE